MSRLLFVDDDPMVLRAMRRAFGREHRVETAEGGPDALDRLRADAAFEVVVTDYTMPGMTGVEFVAEARSIAERPRYLMLTGNRELGVASEAVNDGEVYRLLHKPCDDETLGRAIRDAAESFAVASAREQVLRKTFVGGIGAVATLLENALPEFAGVGAGAVDRVEQLRAAIGVRERWEYKIAARLSLIGFAAGRRGAAVGRARGGDAVADGIDEFRVATQAAAAQLGKIPNLEFVAAILADLPEADGSICSFKPRSDAAVRSVGANLIRVGLLAEMLLREGVDVATAAQEVTALLPAANAAVIEALAAMPESPDEPEGRAIGVADLRPGMVLSDGVTGVGGAALLRCRTRLTEAQVRNLRDAAESGRLASEVRVTDASREAFAGQPDSQ